MRRQTLIAVLLLVTLLGGASLFVSISGADQASKELSSTLLLQAAARTRLELDRFFAPTLRAIAVTASWAEAGQLDISEVESLNSRFMPILASDEAVSSMLIANPAGDEYMLLHLNGRGWQNRVVRMNAPDWGVARNERQHRDGDGVLTRTTVETRDYDPRARPWFVGAMEHPGTVHWTAPYRFRTTGEPGITASIAVPRHNPRRVIAFDLKLSDISAFTRNLEVSPNGWVAVLDNDRVVGRPALDRTDEGEEAPSVATAPRGQNTEEIPHYSALGSSMLDALLASVDASNVAPDEHVWRDVGGDYGLVMTHGLSDDRNLLVAVLIPERDVEGRVTEQRNRMLLVLLFGLVLAIVVTILLDRMLSARLQRAVREVTQVGQYLLEERIGSGGMGTVYRASHSMLRRPTAVKLLREDRRRKKDLARFEREVQLTAQLTHPNTIAIYDYGLTPDGAFYYAMELLDGITLQTLVEATGPLPPARVIHVLRQVLGSLAEAHDVGLIHRDIKPANIMLCRRGGLHDFVKVLDFGLVKRLENDSGADLSGTEGFAGTPLFIAPEAVTKPKSPDPRSDLYAVGAVGYYLLTGTPVFQGRTAVETITLHLRAVPDAPSARVGHAIAADLERVILLSLEKDVAGRPNDARQMLRMLETCADAHVWREDDAQTWWETHGKAATTRATTGDSQVEGEVDGDGARVGDAMTVDMRRRTSGALEDD